MGLADALNTRVNGEADPDHRVTPAANDPLPPLLPLAPPLRRGPTYSEDTFIHELQRLRKGCDFMLDHLYDELGKANIEMFAKLAESVYSHAYIYLVKVSLDGANNSPGTVPSTPAGDEPDDEGDE